MNKMVKWQFMKKKKKKKKELTEVSVIALMMSGIFGQISRLITNLPHIH